VTPLAVAKNPVGAGAAVLAVLVAAFIGTVIVIAEAVVRLGAAIKEARSHARPRR